ncbi:MAG: twin-arginine translocase TatA/TatE family subunit [Chloroflexi bacterium]|nr:twin-arginine translocase TatA/TatE family subunit [Chloroflexota bacterium]
MFGVGITEFLFILAIAMIVLGPDRLPEAMGQLGRLVRKIRAWAYEFRAEFDEEIQLLRGEVEALQREAELTRQELQEIHAEVAATVGEAQDDLDSAAQDIASELGSASQVADAQLGDAAKTLTNPVAAASAAPAPRPAAAPAQPAPTPAAAPAASLPFADQSPGDAMASAISQAFSAANGGAQDQPAQVPPAARWQSPVEGQPAISHEGATMARFSPESGQYAALLRAAAGAGPDSLEAGREALSRQGRLDAGELEDYAGKGPMAAALLWTASMQAHVDGDSIEVDRRDADGQIRVTVSLARDPFGLERPIDAPAARLARHYDRAFFEGLGVAMEDGTLLAEGAEQTRFDLTELPASEIEGDSA